MAPADVSWLHVSDFHVGMDQYAQRNIFKYILAEVDAYKGSGFTQISFLSAAT